MPKATVRLQHLSTNQIEQAVSDEQGRFGFRHIPGALWQMTVRAAEYQPHQLDTLQLGGAAYDLRITLRLR
ncbi:carboxypeptidase-like regulatory domain-containing protein [Hymenobacter sp. B81]|uniref:carboxypeptidase-like regulatory domain-containing protein n=1 Tax=Hymenobacter sp. B81 TaxID=3344878 RepID=UPI0037DC1597